MTNGKRIVIALLIALVAVPVFAAGFASNVLEIEVTGYMAPRMDFDIRESRVVGIDLSDVDGKQVSLASFYLASNTIGSAMFSVIPEAGESFSLFDSSSGAEYPFEIAICGFDREGRMVSVTQTNGVNSVDLKSSDDAAVSGEVIACFPLTEQGLYFDYDAEDDVSELPDSVASASAVVRFGLVMV